MAGKHHHRRPLADPEAAIQLQSTPPDFDGPDCAEKPPQKPKRVASLDVFRGLTVAVMILVDGAGGEWPAIGHAPWNGCHLADFVMPFFLFIVGMAVPLSLKRITNRSGAIRRVGFRTIKLLLWGILLQGGFLHDPDKLTYGVNMKMIRWCGILQRIAIAYLAVSLLEILTKRSSNVDISMNMFSLLRLYLWQWILGAFFLVVYFAAIYGTHVPDWEFRVHNPDSKDFGKILTVTCGVRGSLDPSCNPVGYFDRKILGINHMYYRPAIRRSKACTENSPHAGPLRKDAPAWCQAPFEPEGIISSISSILTAIVGVHFGHVLVHVKGHASRLKQWVAISSVLIIVGNILHFTSAIPLNKQLYSFSYFCVTAGAATLMFVVFYVLIDVLGFQAFILPLKWIGMNAMLVFVLAAEDVFESFLNGWYYDSPNNTLVYWIQKHVFIGLWHSKKVGILLYVIFARIFFWAFIAGILHSRGIYWKL